MEHFVHSPASLERERVAPVDVILSRLQRHVKGIAEDAQTLPLNLLNFRPLISNWNRLCFTKKKLMYRLEAQRVKIQAPLEPAFQSG
jgi:hypothetical protein